MVTAIKVPDLPSVGTITVKVVHMTTLAVLETASMTFAGETYSGDLINGLVGQFLFKLYSGAALAGTRIGSIAADAGPYILFDRETIVNDGRGTYVVTITINDGTNPIAGAIVRISTGGFIVVLETDVNGEARFALDNGTYEVAVSDLGFLSNVFDLTVSGITSATFSLVSNGSVLPASPNLTTGVMLVLDEFGEPEAGVPVSIQQTAGPGTAGYGRDGKIRTEISAVDGTVEFAGMGIGSTYKAWRGASATTGTALFATRITGASVSFIVPNLQPSFNIPEIIGIDVEV